MDSTYAAVLVLSVATTYATWIAGLVVGTPKIPPYLGRVFDSVPLGADTVLAVLGLTDASGRLRARYGSSSRMLPDRRRGSPFAMLAA